MNRQDKEQLENAHEHEPWGIPITDDNYKTSNDLFNENYARTQSEKDEKLKEASSNPTPCPEPRPEALKRPKQEKDTYTGLQIYQAFKAWETDTRLNPTKYMNETECNNTDLDTIAEMKVNELISYMK